MKVCITSTIVFHQSAMSERNRKKEKKISVNFPCRMFSIESHERKIKCLFFSRRLYRVEYVSFCSLACSRSQSHIRNLRRLRINFKAYNSTQTECCTPKTKLLYMIWILKSDNWPSIKSILSFSKGNYKCLHTKIE